MKNLDHQLRLLLWTLNFYIQLNAFLKVTSNSIYPRINKWSSCSFYLPKLGSLCITPISVHLFKPEAPGASFSPVFPSPYMCNPKSSIKPFTYVYVCVCYNICVSIFSNQVIFSTTISPFSIFLFHLPAFFASFPFPIPFPNSNFSNLLKRVIPLPMFFHLPFI